MTATRSAAVQRLVARGLLVRDTDPADRRRDVITLGAARIRAAGPPIGR